MKTLKTKKLMAGVLLAALTACGGSGSKNNSATGTTNPENKNQLSDNRDEGSPSIDDASQISTKNVVMAASITGVGAGAMLMYWGPKKVEALRKFFLTVDQNEAMKINDKLLELVRAREAYDDITKKLPTSIDDVIKGNFESGQSEKIRDRLAEIFVRRSQRVQEIRAIEASIASLEAAPTATVRDIKANATGLDNYLDALYAQKPEAQVEPGYNKAQIESLRQKLSLSNTGLGQIDDELAKAVQANAKVFKVIQNWQLAGNRLSRVAKYFDIGFHRTLRSLATKMVKFHSDRVKLKLTHNGNEVTGDLQGKNASIKVIGAELVRKNFNFAKVAYFTAGGLVIVGSGYTLWTVLDDADTQGKELALKVTDSFEEGDEPTQEEAASLSKEDAQPIRIPNL